jgi:hypothetical protein
VIDISALHDEAAERDWLADIAEQLADNQDES